MIVWTHLLRLRGRPLSSFLLEQRLRPGRPEPALEAVWLGETDQEGVLLSCGRDGASIDIDTRPPAAHDLGELGLVEVVEARTLAGHGPLHRIAMLEASPTAAPDRRRARLRGRRQRLRVQGRRRAAADDRRATPTPPARSRSRCSDGDAAQSATRRPAWPGADRRVPPAAPPWPRQWSPSPPRDRRSARRCGRPEATPPGIAGTTAARRRRWRGDGDDVPPVVAERLATCRTLIGDRRDEVVARFHGSGRPLMPVSWPVRSRLPRPARSRSGRPDLDADRLPLVCGRIWTSTRARSVRRPRIGAPPTPGPASARGRRHCPRGGDATTLPATGPLRRIAILEAFRPGTRRRRARLRDRRRRLRVRDGDGLRPTIGRCRRSGVAAANEADLAGASAPPGRLELRPRDAARSQLWVALCAIEARDRTAVVEPGAGRGAVRRPRVSQRRSRHQRRIVWPLGARIPGTGR